MSAFRCEAADSRVDRKGDFMHLIDRISVRRFPKQRADRLFYEHDARIQNEQRDNASHVAVQINSCEPVNEHSDDDDDTRNHVVSVVRSGCYDRK